MDSDSSINLSVMVLHRWLFCSKLQTRWIQTCFFHSTEFLRVCIELKKALFYDFDKILFWFFFNTWIFFRLIPMSRMPADRSPTNPRMSPMYPVPQPSAIPALPDAQRCGRRRHLTIAVCLNQLFIVIFPYLTKVRKNCRNVWRSHFCSAEKFVVIFHPQNILYYHGLFRVEHQQELWRVYCVPRELEGIAHHIALLAEDLQLASPGAPSQRAPNCGEFQSCKHPTGKKARDQNSKALKKITETQILSFWSTTNWVC